MQPNIENQTFFSRFAKGLAYLAIVVKNVKEKYGRNYRLKNDSWFHDCLYTCCFFHSFFVLMKKQISAKSAQLADFLSV